MTGLGTIINVAAILLGGAAGLAFGPRLPAKYQQAIKGLLGLLTIYVGLSTTWGAFHGTFGQVCAQFGILLLALMLGNATGRLLGLQRGLNWLGGWARERLSAGNPSAGARFSDGFVTCTLLFCVGPMAVLGSLQDGLNGDIRTLALKALMDGLATMGFVTTLGWGAMAAALPVLAYQGTLTLLARSLEPYLQNPMMMDSINAVGGMLVFCIALVVLELKKVELANYLPSLVFAPLLTSWWR